MKAHRDRALLRHSHTKQATPPWANLEDILSFYDNRPAGYHVDHVIPLRGRDVCGLHVRANLQYLPASENLSKGNRLALSN